MKMNKFFVWMFVFIVLSGFVFAQPPLTVTSDAPNGLLLESPPPRFSPINAPAQTVIHVFNSSNGVELGNESGVYCEGDILNLSGEIMYETNATVQEDHFIIGYPENLTSQTGIYGYTIYCQQNESGIITRGGFFTGYIDVTRSGKEIIDSGSKSIATMIGLLLLTAIFVFMYNMLGKEHTVLKSLLVFFLPIIIIYISGLASQLLGHIGYASMGTSIYTIMIWFVRIFYFYVIIGFGIKSLNYLSKAGKLK